MRLATSHRAAAQVLLLAAAVTAGVVALAPASAADGRIPFNARLSGTAAFTSPTTVEFDGAGYATQLGRFTGGGVAILEAPGGSCPGGVPGIPNVHTEAFTAANGDQLVIRMVNVGCPTGPTTFHGTGHWTVLGGTGRFEGLTGQGTNEGDADFATNTFELRLTGTLSHP